MNDTKSLGLIVDDIFVRKLIQTGHDFDVMKDPGKNCFDSKWGLIQVWCVPDDKPACWDAPLEDGEWGPSELVGDIVASWLEDEIATRAELVVQIYARDLIDYRARGKERYSGAVRAQPEIGDVFTEEEIGQLFAWLEKKAWELIRLAQLAPAVVGVKCPFCAWVLDEGEMLNVLLDHVATEHAGQVQVRSLCLGYPTTLETDRGVFPLERAEDFSR